MSKRSKLTLHHNQIGTVPDRVIAKLAGCSIATVHYYRQRHGIPSFRSTTGGVTTPRPGVTTPPVKAGTPATPHVGLPAGSQGYTATLQTPEGTQEMILIAADITEAAEKASAVGMVVRLTYLGEAL